ncbi:MAG: XrtA-associated tyrosine autokinase, partial [Burkholderiaceae bacterium]
MSLIERAVARLTDVKPKPDAPPAAAGPEASSPAERKTSIEALADRLADVSTRRATPPSADGTPPSPQAAVPAAGVGTAPAIAPTPSVTTHSAIAPVPAAPATTIAGPAPVAAPALQPAQPAPAASPDNSPAPVRIHLEALRARGMVVPNGPATQTGQEFRVIKRPLLANAYGRGGRPAAPQGRYIMVTSAFPGEGKSFCAVNLAMSIAAERDHGVILIDADVARPSIPRELGVQVDRGLMDWLIDGSPDLGQLVLPTNVDTLSILPSGRRHEHATELLASEAMGRLLEQLNERYPDRIFIFDSPPLLVTTEARVLASHMGQIVMVVEAGKTPRDSVSQALST